jgi:hypothetical protein
MRLAAMMGTIAIAACAQGSAGVSAPPLAAVRGKLRFLEKGQLGDTAIGPVVVILEPTDPATLGTRPRQLFRITSTTDRFDPGFTAVGEGDYIVFVNGGAVSHRLFSADIGPDVQIPVSPGGSSEPQLMDRAGELRFFCSLHPDENFSVLVTADDFFAAVDGNGEYFVGPLPGGSYRLSIWSPRLKGPIRTVEVESGRTAVETIWLDPDLIGR